MLVFIFILSRFDHLHRIYWSIQNESCCRSFGMRYRWLLRVDNLPVRYTTTKKKKTNLRISHHCDFSPAQRIVWNKLQNQSHNNNKKKNIIWNNQWCSRFRLFRSKFSSSVCFVRSFFFFNFIFAIWARAKCLNGLAFFFRFVHTFNTLSCVAINYFVIKKTWREKKKKTNNEKERRNGDKRQETVRKLVEMNFVERTNFIRHCYIRFLLQSSRWVCDSSGRISTISRDYFSFSFSLIFRMIPIAFLFVRFHLAFI